MDAKLDLGWVTIPTEEFERLHAEIKRLLLDNAELSTECDQWQRKVADCWREIEQLRSRLDHA